MPLSTITALPAAPSRSDAPTTFNTLADAWVGALGTFTTQMNQVISEIPAAVTGTDYSGTSTTSVTIGTGSKAFTTQTGKNFTIGQSVRVAYTTTPANYMDGQVTAYDTGTGALTVNVTAVGGAGTQALWTISLAVTAGSFLPLSGGTLTGALTVGGALTCSGLGSFISPNSGTTGAVIVRDAAANPDAAHLQFTNNAGSSQYAFIKGLSAGGLNFNNQLTVNSASASFAVPAIINVASGISAGAIGYTGGNLVFGNGASQLTVVSTTATQTLTNKTLTNPGINGATINSGSITLATDTPTPNSVGFRGLPVSGNASGTLALTDAGQMLVVSTNQTIPANASIAFPIGTVVVIANNSGATITVSITADTLRLAGGTTTGTRTIAIYGECSLIKMDATTWWASGNVT